MKIKLLVLFTILFSSITIAQIGQIGLLDTNFNTAITSHAPPIDGCDGTVADGQISVAEAGAFTGTVNLIGFNVSDLTDIKYFTQIQKLKIKSSPNLVNLDLSHNSQLTELEADWCDGLVNLNIANGNNFTDLSLRGHSASISILVAPANLPASLPLDWHGLTDMTLFTAHEVVTSIQIYDGAISAYQGTYTIVREVLPSSANDTTVSWVMTSSDPASGVSTDNVATISTFGIVTAVGNGVVKFRAKSVDGSEITSNEATFTITGQEREITGVTLVDKTVVYDGQSQSLTVTGTIPTGVSVSYTTLGTNTNTRTEHGTINVRAELSGTGYTTKILNGILKIKKRPIIVKPTVGQSKTYGDLDPTVFSHTLDILHGESLLGGDNFFGPLTRDYGDKVGTYDIIAGGFTRIERGTVDVSHNYDITVKSASFEIKKKSIIVSPATGQFKEYSNTEPTLVCSQVSKDALVTGDKFVGTLTRDAGENVKSDYRVYADQIKIKTPSGTDNTGNYSITFNNVFFEIKPKQITITPAAGQFKVYGDDDPKFVCNQASIGALAQGDKFSGKMGRPVGEIPSVYPLYLGNLKIKKGSVDVTSNYHVNFISVNFRIKKRKITITANANQTKVYGDNEPTDFLKTITNGSLASGEQFYGELTRDPGENVNNYAIKQGGLIIIDVNQNVTLNYDITFIPANFEIKQKPIVIEVVAGQSKIYGGSEPVFLYSITSGNLVFGGVFGGVLKRTPGEGVSNNFVINVGTLKIKSPLDADVTLNYDITFIPKNFAITPRPIEVTAKVVSKVYGVSDPASFDYDLSLDITNDNLCKDCVGLSGFLTRTANAASEEVGTHAIEQGGLTTVNNPNYTITYVSKNLTIIPRAITVTVKPNQEKEYGESDPLTFGYDVSPDITANNICNNCVGLIGSLTRISNTVATEQVGDHEIQQGTLNNYNNLNYTITYNSSNKFKITPRLITVTAKLNQEKVYGESDPSSFGYDVSPALTTNDAALVGSLTRVSNTKASQQVGSHEILQGTLNNGNNSNSNYTIIYDDSVKFKITKRQITITANLNQVKIYGDNDPNSFGYSITSGSLSIGEEFSGSLTRETGENVGYYKFSIGSGVKIKNGTKDTTDNYDISLEVGNFEITKRQITITANSNQSKIYGDNEPNSFGYSMTSGSFRIGDESSGSLTRETGENVGDYKFSIGLGVKIKKDTTDNTGNYDISLELGSFEITPRPITITANAEQTKVEGDPDPVPYTYTITEGNLVNGDTTLLGELTRKDEEEEVGEYEIEQGDLNNIRNPNYNINYVLANFSITERFFVTKIVVADEQITIDGGSVIMVAKVLPSNTTISGVTWSITNAPGIGALAKIDPATGEVTAFANGTVTVTVTAIDGSGVKGIADVVITNQTGTAEFAEVISIQIAGGLKIDTYHGELQLEASIQPIFALALVSWSITDGAELAEIDEVTGVITAIADGTIEVTAIPLDGSLIQTTENVEITNQTKIPVGSIDINQSIIKIDKGTVKITTNIMPTNATDQTVRWTVTNIPGIGSLSKIDPNTGELTAFADGTVTVTATANDGSGVKGIREVEIINQTGRAKFIDVLNIRIGRGLKIDVDQGTLQLESTVSPRYALPLVAWSISKGRKYAIIDQVTGLVTAVANGTIEIKATAIDGSGAKTTANVVITNQIEPIEGLSGLSSIKVPKAFTPNEDGKNDIFIIKNIMNYPNNTLQVFNRWGRKVYTSTNYKNNWDGKSRNNNIKVPTGSYYYIFTIDEFKDKQKQGLVYIDY